MALGSTQPLVKMSTRNILGGKGSQCVRLTTSPPLRAECHGIWEPKPPGTLWATPGLLRDSFTFYYGVIKPLCFIAMSCLNLQGSISTLRGLMKVINFFEMSGSDCPVMQRHIPAKLLLETSDHATCKFVFQTVTKYKMRIIHAEILSNSKSHID
jgi:hypothetical protein